MHNVNDLYLLKEADIDVVGLGSALLDLTIEVDDELLEKLNLKKGQMCLIDDERSKNIFNVIKNFDIKITPGGSSANTLAGLANLGSRCVFIGKVGNDKDGKLYISETEKIGVKTRLPLHEKMTGHAITFITPDSERTFATNLGASLYFCRDDVFVDDIKKCKILHVEGYLLEGDEKKDATLYAMETAKNSNAKVSLDLSDPALIIRNKEEFKAIVREYADIVFANDEEAAEFTENTEEEALSILGSLCDIAVVKLGARGSIIKFNNTILRISPFKTSVVNTNGAGDMYAAGFLYGLVNNMPVKRAGIIGSYGASLAVSRIGARIDEKIDLSRIDE